MGVADSPIRDRALFIEGAPRSGTTWLAAVMSTHPDIAGIANESHLFDFGLERILDNYDGLNRDDDYPFLAAWVSRAQLVDLARDFSDGVLVAMRDATKPEARFVLEKTPLVRGNPRLQMQRKLEIYPDAWYIHMVRDGEAVTRSLMRTPFAAGLSHDECKRWWQDAVGALREVAGRSERYREVDYDSLRADPSGALDDVLAWLGLETDDTIRERFERVSRERFSQFGDPPPARSRRRLGGVLDRLLNRGGDAPPEDAPAWRLLGAARDGDAETMAAATTDDFALRVGAPGGDAESEGDEARLALREWFERMFRRKYVSERWGGEPPDGPERIEFAGITADGARVDVAFVFSVSGDRVAALTVEGATPP